MPPVTASKPYSGKILWVDLATRQVWVEHLPDSFYEKYLGGMGLAAAILYRTISPGADPLGPQNVLGFVPGVLTATPSLFTGRWMVVGKSPLTGTWGDSNCGGVFAAAIKQCGYDGIFVGGISPAPVYLYITHAAAEVRDAAALWGKDTLETEQILWQLPAKKPAVACIGPAGEKRSLLAGISHDQGRMAARAGLGAVMGSKNLKAVALAGSMRTGCARPEEMKALSQQCNRTAQFSLPWLPADLPGKLGALVRKLPFGVSLDGILSMALWRKWGTTSMTQASIEMGDAPTKNWAGSEHDFPLRRSQAIHPGNITASEVRKYHCYACPLGCGGMVTLPDGSESHKPEYETVTAFASLLLNTNLEAVFRINARLNRAGMDTISTGNTVAFAFEAFEKGLITSQDTGGLELKWGDTAAIEALVEKMIDREGIGDVLADGVQRAAAHFDGRAAEFGIHAGGQDIAFHDPRYDPGIALHSSVDPSPGRHTSGAGAYYEVYRLWKRLPRALAPGVTPFYRKGEKYRPSRTQAVKAVAISQYTQLYNAAGLCFFGALMGVDRLPLFEWLNAATGWQRSPQEWMRIGHRIQTLRQMFNIRQGIDPRRLKLSRRALGLPPMRHGANRGRTIDLEAMMKLYWAEIGWDPETGVPTPQTLQELELQG